MICLSQIDYLDLFPAENQPVSIAFNLESVVGEKIRIPFSFMLDDIRTAEPGATAVTVPAAAEGDPSAAAYAKIIDSKICVLRLIQPLASMSVRVEKDDGFIYVVTPVRTAH